MRDDQFEWDDAKAETNFVRHGVSFRVARAVFADPFALEWVDDRQNYGEERFIIIGMVAGRLLLVTYTMRGERIRLISARGAEPHERGRYHEENRSPD